jgi:hypothetical protein
MGDAWSICRNHKAHAYPRKPVKHEKPKAITNIKRMNWGTFQIDSGIKGSWTRDSNQTKRTTKKQPRSSEKMIYQVRQPFGAFTASVKA